MRCSAAPHSQCAKGGLKRAACIGNATRARATHKLNSPDLRERSLKLVRSEFELTDRSWISQYDTYLPTWFIESGNCCHRPFSSRAASHALSPCNMCATCATRVPVCASLLDFDSCSPNRNEQCMADMSRLSYIGRVLADPRVQLTTSR